MQARRVLTALCAGLVVWAGTPVWAARIAKMPGLSERPGEGRESRFERLYFDPEETIVTTTRHPKPVSQVAENVVLIGSQEIQDMNAHTLGDVLKRIPGVYTYTFGNHLGATPLAHIQGSGEPNPFRNGHEERHVLILLDGIPWSSETAGPFLETIPVGLIERIEVIKGPASSTWGSSLGGVVNVITKGAGKGREKGGASALSCGERGTFDARQEVWGRKGPAAVYLQGQVQRAEWHQPGSAGFDGISGFGKVEFELSPNAMLVLSAGHSDEEVDSGHLRSEYAYVQQEPWAAFARLGLDITSSPNLGVHLDAYRFEQRVAQRTQEDGTWAPKGALLMDNIFEEEHFGLQGTVSYAGPTHTLVAGVDYRRTAFTQRTDSGAFFQSLGNPPRFRVGTDVTRWGVYINDTIRTGAFNLVPGLRYDDSTLTDPFWSPSVGATWGVGETTLLRLTVARGFGAPPLNYLRGGGIGFDPNPDLEPEKIWSYQGGVETGALHCCWLKVSVFRHEVSGAIRTGTADGPNRYTWINRGTIWRTGFEAEVETAEYAGVRLKAAFGYVKIEVSGRPEDQEQHQVLVGLYYDPSPGFHAEAAGRYVWWDYGPGSEEGEHNDFLWDVNFRKTLVVREGTEVEVFATVHNLFNGDAMRDTDRGQEPRWLEVGIRMRF